MREMVCIVCPMGCHLSIEEESLVVSGNNCPRGEKYAKEELTAPKRVITSTVRIKNGIHNRMPVKSDGGIPKELNMKCMEMLNNIELQSPVRRGEIVIKNILGTGVDILACRDM